MNLTLAEFKVLVLLASRLGWLYSRTHIVEAVRGFNHSVTDRGTEGKSQANGLWAKRKAVSFMTGRLPKINLVVV